MDNYIIAVGTNPYYKVKCFKYLGSLLTNKYQNYEDMLFRFETGHSCYYSVQNILSFRLLSKNLKIKIYKTIILPVVLYGCEAWSLTLSEEHRLTVLQNSELIIIIIIIIIILLDWFGSG